MTSRVQPPAFLAALLAQRYALHDDRPRLPRTGGQVGESATTVQLPVQQVGESATTVQLPVQEVPAHEPEAGGVLPPIRHVHQSRVQPPAFLAAMLIQRYGLDDTDDTLQHTGAHDQVSEPLTTVQLPVLEERAHEPEAGGVLPPIRHVDQYSVQPSAFLTALHAHRYARHQPPLVPDQDGEPLATAQSQAQMEPARQPEAGGVLPAASSRIPSTQTEPVPRVTQRDVSTVFTRMIYSGVPLPIVFWLMGVGRFDITNFAIPAMLFSCLATTFYIPAAARAVLRGHASQQPEERALGNDGAKYVEMIRMGVALQEVFHSMGESNFDLVGFSIPATSFSCMVDTFYAPGLAFEHSGPASFSQSSSAALLATNGAKFKDNKWLMNGTDCELLTSPRDQAMVARLIDRAFEEAARAHHEQ